MVNQIQKEVIKHISENDLKKLKRQKKIEAIVSQKLEFVFLLYQEKTVPQASKLIGVCESTGYRWFDEWNNGALEGLYPKYHNGGVKSKLTDEQFKELDSLMYQEEYLNTRKVHDLIKKHFDVDYSMSRIRNIVHFLGYSYKKGYIKSHKMPDDAEEILKKNSYL